MCAAHNSQSWIVFANAKMSEISLFPRLYSKAIWKYRAPLGEVRHGVCCLRAVGRLLSVVGDEAGDFIVEQRQG
jgi:hypothetical protein